MKIDLTESEYRTILEALGWVSDLSERDRRRHRYTRLRDHLRVRWERAADEQQRKELVK